MRTFKQDTFIFLSLKQAPSKNTYYKLTVSLSIDSCIFSDDPMNQPHSFELETKLQEMERRRIDDEGRHHADQEKNQERLSQAHAAKDQAERELIGFK